MVAHSLACRHGAALALALVLPLSVQAKTFRCGAGDVQCLIDAINEANANGKKNTIRLEPGTYTLTAVDNTTTNGPNGLPLVTSTLTIRGAGAKTTIIERDTSAPEFRFLTVAGTGTLTLKGFTLRGGGEAVITQTLVGGGIFNTGTLALTNCSLTGNTANLGGGIANTGTLALANCSLTGNTAGSGGGIINYGTATLTNCSLTGNTTPAIGDGGGGILNHGTLTFTNSTLADNTSTRGGGLHNTSTATLTNCTLTGNRADDPFGSVGGGGIATVDSGAQRTTLTLTNCTLADNTANLGGGITNFDGTATLTNSTLTDNTALDGGGIYSHNGSMNLQNTILALNTARFPSPQADDCGGVVTSLGNNLIGDPTGCRLTLLSSDLTGDPGLGDFTDNGRPGKGHFPLLSTSQAIDAGNDAVCPHTDQLGRRRLGPCDIGAIEFRDRDDRHQEDDDQQDKGHDDTGPVAAAQAAFR